MKKLVLVAIVSVLAAFSANAQFFSGFAFDVNYANSGSQKASVKQVSSESYGISLAPQFGWFINDKLAIGARISFDANKNISKSSLSSILSGDKEEQHAEHTIGWDVAPFARYEFLRFGRTDRWSVLAEAHLYFGMAYPTQPKMSYDFNQKYTYGIQLMPVVGFDVNEKSTVLLHFALLSLGYAGSTAVYDNDVKEFNNTALLFTGKLSGMFRSFMTGGLYGLKIGMVRRF